jgi:hypothetical protein
VRGAGYRLVLDPAAQRGLEAPVEKAG